MKEGSEPEGRTAPWRKDSFRSFRGRTGLPGVPVPPLLLQNRSFTAHIFPYTKKDPQAEDTLKSPMPAGLFILMAPDAPYTRRYLRSGERRGTDRPLQLNWNKGTYLPYAMS